MHSTASSSAIRYRWSAETGRLEADAAGPGAATPGGDDAVVVADSWLVTNGSALALSVHRDRFLATAGPAAPGLQPARFFDTAVALLPRAGDSFPRVELRRAGGESALLLTVRPAPPRTASVVVETLDGPDPRRVPTVKGPDLEALGRLRADAAERGVDELVILGPDGSVVEGCYSAIAWWRGDDLCVPDAGLPRVDSVTARTLVTLATALGVTVLHERSGPEELDGREVWLLNALQGIRIAREWRGGPRLAAEPGRLALWRERIAALRRPLPA